MVNLFRCLESSHRTGLQEKELVQQSNSSLRSLTPHWNGNGRPMAGQFKGMASKTCTTEQRSLARLPPHINSANREAVASVAFRVLASTPSASAGTAFNDLGLGSTWLQIHRSATTTYEDAMAIKQCSCVTYIQGESLFFRGTGST